MNKLQQLLEQEWNLLGEAKRIFLYSKDVCSGFTEPAAEYTNRQKVLSMRVEG